MMIKYDYKVKTINIKKKTQVMLHKETYAGLAQIMDECSGEPPSKYRMLSQ